MYNSKELMNLVDPMLYGNFPENEAIRFLKVGLLCVQEKSKLRPQMSTAIKMMNGETNIDGDDVEISQPGLIGDIMDVKVGRRSSSKSMTENGS